MEYRFFPTVNRPPNAAAFLSPFDDISVEQLFKPEPPRVSVAWQSLVDRSPVVMLLIDRAGVIQFQSEELSRATGWPEDACVGRRCLDALRVENREGVTAAFESMLSGKLGRLIFDFEMTATSGDSKVFAATLQNSLDDPAVQAIVLSAHEITARKSHELRLRHNANHDALTGLFNRRAAMRTISAWIAESETGGARPAVLLLDIDGFKTVNDVYGHAVGDGLLVALAARLSRLDAANVSAARLSGDELLLFTRSDDIEKQAPLLAERALEAIRQPVLIDGHWIFTSASVGIAACPEGGRSADELIRCADLALYQAKDAGRNTARWFDQSAAETLRAKMMLRRELAQALPNNEFCIQFQPIVNVVTNTVHSHECLLRWKHNTHGLLVASDFIAEVDGAGLTRVLTEWVIREVFELARSNAAIESRPLKVNVHPRVFQRPDFAEDLLRGLRNWNIEPRRLELEITEEDFVRVADASPANITALSTAGVHIIIDDFGTGFSNFGYLTRFPVHAIKIDRNFVAQIGVSERAETLIGAMIGLAEELGIHSIGEGIENIEQADFLKHHGCVLQQGYLWGRPTFSGLPSGFMKTGA
ncbi:MAG: EAL domain-containing protein [Betaproteobacteria bacterium]|nr:MAG: EAL domain-containing protein [Betaproteobacteria bacterium]